MAPPPAKRRSGGGGGGSGGWPQCGGPPCHLLLPKRRVTRSYGAGEIDFLPRLPTELSQLILGQLSVRDLARCMSVSKAWYGLANSDSLWRRLCLKHGLFPQDEENFMVDENSGLCKWAQIWRWFRYSPSWRWYARRWRTLELFNSSGSYLKHASDGQSAAFITDSVLTVRHPTQIEKIKYRISLPFSETVLSHSSCCLAVQNEYIVVSKCNIVLIYKLGKTQYRCVLALSMTEDDSLTKTHKATRMFVKNEMRRTSNTIWIMALNKTWLWLRDMKSMKTFVFNLRTEKVKRVDLLYHRCLTPTWLISWARKNLRVDNYSGKTVFKLNQAISEVRANTRLLLTFGFDKEKSVVEPDGRGGHSIRQVMETWELGSGRRLSSQLRPHQAFFELHPTKDILYQMNAETKALTAVDAVTGGPLWKVGLPKGVTALEEWCLQVVCGRYLMLFQFSLPPHTFTSTVYLFNALTGQYMYSTKRLPGKLVYISDCLIIAKTATQVFLRTFV